jgi:hypothetical protein
MSISLKDNIDRVMTELDTGLSEMELLYVNVDDVLVALCDLATFLGGYSGELERGVKHVQHVYLSLVGEVRGSILLGLSSLADGSSSQGFMVSVYGG